MSKTYDAIFNGQRITVPPVARAEELMRAFNLDPAERALIERMPDGNRYVRPQEELRFEDADEVRRFADIPAAIEKSGADKS